MTSPFGNISPHDLLRYAITGLNPLSLPQPTGPDYNGPRLGMPPDPRGWQFQQMRAAQARLDMNERIGQLQEALLGIAGGIPSGKGGSSMAKVLGGKVRSGMTSYDIKPEDVRGSQAREIPRRGQTVRAQKGPPATTPEGLEVIPRAYLERLQQKVGIRPGTLPNTDIPIPPHMASLLMRHPSGRPVVAFHGTNAEFDRPRAQFAGPGLYNEAIATQRPNPVTNSYKGDNGYPSVYATTRPELAASYGKNIHPMLVLGRNWLDMDAAIPQFRNPQHALTNEKGQQEVRNADETGRQGRVFGPMAEWMDKYYPGKGDALVDHMRTAAVEYGGMRARDAARGGRNAARSNPFMTYGDMWNALNTAGADPTDFFRQTLGTRGFTHVGGGIAGRGNNHRVFIAHDDRQLVPLSAKKEMPAPPQLRTPDHGFNYAVKSLPPEVRTIVFEALKAAVAEGADGHSLRQQIKLSIKQNPIFPGAKPNLKYVPSVGSNTQANLDRYNNWMHRLQALGYAY